MRVTHEQGDFFAVYGASASMRRYFQFSVPTTHRRYESEPSPHWVVHRKYLSEGLIPVKQDHRATLFLTKDAPRFMIDAAWKALARVYHPDRGGDPAAFHKAKEAYEELKKNARDNDGDDAEETRD